MTHCIIIHIYNTLRHECQRAGVKSRGGKLGSVGLARYNSLMRRPYVLLCLLFIVLLAPVQHTQVAAQETVYIAQAGDTWAGMAMRYSTSIAELKALNPHMNTMREPAIGRMVSLPEGVSERFGRLTRSSSSLAVVSAEYHVPVWSLAIANNVDSPYRPNFYRALYIPGDGRVRDLPAGIESLELSAVPAMPGMALGLRGTTRMEDVRISAALDGLPISFETVDGRFIGVVGTGAFYRGGEPEMVVQIADTPVWIQPWAFGQREWEYQELTLTGEAAQIDQQARDEERTRLQEIWTIVSPNVLWDEPFQTPVKSYLEVSAHYGARRSYNGGPYLTYHEGVDLSAYGGTPVLAAAAGTVALAEPLYVRGGTVIIDHGLGVYTGYYHMSAIHAIPGQQVRPGDLLGEVGTTGLSTGNHLHWDLLINGVWVDAAAWQETGMDCWLLEGIGRACNTAPSDN